MDAWRNNPRNAGIEDVPGPGEQIAPLIRRLIPLAILGGLGWALLHIDQLAPKGIPIPDPYDETGIIMTTRPEARQLRFVPDGDAQRDLSDGQKVDANARCTVILPGTDMPKPPTRARLLGRRVFGKWTCGVTLYGYGFQTQIDRIIPIEPVACPVDVYVDQRFRCTVPLPANPPEPVETARPAQVPAPIPIASRGFTPRFPDPPTPYGDDETLAGFYPPAALAHGHQGAVVVQVTFGEDGVRRDCRVTKSSGHSELDIVTCDLVGRHPNFTRVPGGVEADHNGQVIFSQRVVWQLP